jgi:hypothetical protein
MNKDYTHYYAILSSDFVVFIATLGLIIVVGHTMPKAPDPIRTLKLSGIRRG